MSTLDHLPPEIPTARTAWTTPERLALLGVVLAGAVLGWLQRQPPITLGGDDSTYLLLAQALRGGAYVDLFLPGAPAHAQYPPGLPLFIMLVQFVAGPSPLVVQAANLVLLAGTALLVAFVVRRRYSAPIGIGAAAVIMLNPLLLHYTGWVLSEILFVSCAIGAVCVVARPCREIRIRHWGFAMALAVLAFFTRSIGITAVFAVAGGLLVCRRWRLALVGASSLGLLAGWFWYTRWAAGQTLGWSYANDLAYVNPGRAFALMARLLESGRYYVIAIPGRVFGIPDIPDMPVDNLVWVSLLVVPLLIGIWHLWLRWPVAALFLGLSGGVLMIFPFAVIRLLVPLVPLIIVAVLLGVRELAASLGARRPEHASLAVAAFLCAIALVRDVEGAVAQQRCRATSAGACRTEAEQGWIDTAGWLRGAIPESAVVASSKPSTLYRISGRRGIPSRVLFAGELDEILAPEGPVTHIMLTRLWAYERRDLPAYLRAVCERLRPLGGPGSRAIVLEVLPPGATVSAEGCTALLEFYDPTRERPESAH